MAKPREWIIVSSLNTHRGMEATTLTHLRLGSQPAGKQRQERKGAEESALSQIINRFHMLTLKEGGPDREEAGSH